MNDLDLEKVLKSAGLRDKPPADVERAVRDHVRGEWREAVAENRRRSKPPRGRSRLWCTPPRPRRRPVLPSARRARPYPMGTSHTAQPGFLLPRPRCNAAPTATAP